MEIREYVLDPDPRMVAGTENDDFIFLSVVIGNGQIGGNKVVHQNKVLAKGKLTETVPIGNLGELMHGTVQIETNILDVNASTNMCIFTTTFYNQNNQVLFTKIDKGEAPENGIASFRGRYVFKLLMLVVLFLLPAIHTMAQQNAEQVMFHNLETPSSPGLVLLDNAPASIEKPTTPQGFGLSILNFFDGNGGALEFSPFWLMNHPNLTADKMYKNRFPLLYNAAVSMATIKTDSTSYLAGGIRTRLIQIYSKNKLDTLDSIMARLEMLLADPLENIETIEVLRKQYTDLLNIDIEKPLFTVDLAAAMGAGTASNSFNDLGVNRWAVWLLLNYRPGGDNFYITALSRGIRNVDFGPYNQNSTQLDLGLRFNYDISDFCISIEHIQRTGSAENLKNDFRTAIIGSYRISDSFHITSSFGKNFSDLNNIIALAGINFGFSEKTIKAF